MNNVPTLTDLRRRIIRNLTEAEAMHNAIVESAALTVKNLASHKGEPMEFLRALRFDQIGHDPLSGEPLNLIEQLNQTFTILVTLRAIEALLEWHPDAEGFRVALGTSSGRDIESVKKNLVAAEAFAATKPTSNQKIKREQDRLAQDPAMNRYVFFASPGYAPGRHPELESNPNIQVFAVDP